MYRLKFSTFVSMPGPLPPWSYYSNSPCREASSPIIHFLFPLLLSLSLFVWLHLDVISWIYRYLKNPRKEYQENRIAVVQWNYEGKLKFYEEAWFIRWNKDYSYFHELHYGPWLSATRRWRINWSCQVTV